MAGKRKRKKRTPQQEALKQFRKANDTHVVQLELEVTHQQIRNLIDMGQSVLWIKRRLQAYYRKRLEQLWRRKDYRSFIKEYKHAPQPRKKAIGKELDKLQAQLGVTFEAGKEIASHYSKATGIQAVFGLSAAEDVWEGVEKILYSRGKHLHSSWSDNLFTLRAKQANRCIRIQVKDNKLVFILKGVGEMEHLDISGDAFLCEEEAAIIIWLKDKRADEKVAKRFMETGAVFSTYRPKFVTLKIEKIRGKWRVYAQVSVEGVAKPKKRKDGSPRFQRAAAGEIGIDIGVQTYAAVGANVCEMKNLAERCGRAIKDERYLRNLQRHADRSRRVTNPQNYNENGTVKKGKKEWVKSKEYKETQEKIREYYRKCALNRKYAIQEDVNRLRELGNVVVSEKQSMKGWQAGLFGRSIQSRCPGFFRAELKRKFDDYIEVDFMYRASQYDHESDDYKKKTLSQRKHYHSEGRASPRDGYSGFVLWCHDDEYASPDRAKCCARFGDYYEKMTRFVSNCKGSDVKIMNAGF